MNRNSILECTDCGYPTHIRHATDGRCSECHERCANEPVHFSAVLTGEPKFMAAIPGQYGAYQQREISKGSGVFVLELEEVT